MENREYWYWLAGIEALGPLLTRRLLGLYGSPELLYKEEKWPVTELQQQAVDESRRTIAASCRELAELDRQGITWCSFEDERYPKRLLELADAPIGLCCRGCLPDEGPAVGIVGSRACSEYGRSMARFFGEELGKAGIPVISGMAVGVDGIAQQAALDAGGSSFGILGSGIDVCYPPANLPLYERLPLAGGLISEYRPGAQPLSYHFPQRSRLISALSDVLLVIEAREKSGSLITVDQALEQGKEVLALPGRVGDVLSRGCLELIRQGAGVLLDMGSVWEALGKKPTQSAEPAETAGAPLTPAEAKLWEQLSSTPKHLETLMEESGCSLGELSLLLLGLESKKRVRAVSAGQYVRN